MITRRVLGLALFALLPLGACGGDADMNEAPVPTIDANADQGDRAVRVTDVELGRSIDGQGRIADDADTDDFAANDTIYVSVDTEGSATGAQLTARWLFEDGQVVDESSRTVSAGDGAITEFHISNPGGLPAGRYTVEIQLDGRTVETEEFTVR